MRASTYVAGVAVALGLWATLVAGVAVASADDGARSSGPSADSARASHAAPARPRRTGHQLRRQTSQASTLSPSAAVGRVNPAARTARRSSRPTTLSSPSPASVKLPPMPVVKGLSFTVSTDFMSDFATKYVAAGGDPNDGARFFFGDLAVASLDELAGDGVGSQRVRLLLGNLAASGYFGGIWLRDNLSGAQNTSVLLPHIETPGIDLSVSAIGIHLFDAVSAALTGVAKSNRWLVSAVAHASVPVLLALYGYNRGYLDVVLENPPPGVPSMQNTLTCTGFLACDSTAFPLELASSYDDALGDLNAPTSPGWAEMALWTSVLQSATGAGRFVWEGLARAGFSPSTYTALVELSSAYLMVSKAAVLSSMTAYADGDAAVGRASLRLQAGLWMWSGAYFAGLAAGAKRGTLPTLNPS